MRGLPVSILDQLVALSLSLMIVEEHAKYVFDLPESDNSETDDDDSWDSDDSHASRQRRYPPTQRTRMSLLTGKYFEIPVQEDGYEHFNCGVLPAKTSRRKFFHSSASWDDSLDQVIVKKTGGIRTPLGELMERGGDEEEDEEGWDDMAVDSQ
jgi:histone deacetylase 1/2